MANVKRQRGARGGDRGKGNQPPKEPRESRPEAGLGGGITLRDNGLTRRRRSGRPCGPWHPHPMLRASRKAVGVEGTVRGKGVAAGARLVGCDCY